MIKISDSDDIDAVRFALTARGNGEYLCIRDNKIMSTDGRRIHRATLNMVTAEDGLYEVLKNSKKEVILDRIIDDSAYYAKDLIESRFHIEGKVVEIESQYIVGGVLSAAIVYFVGTNGQAINPRYILDVCGIIENRPPCRVTVKLPTDTDAPILVKQHDITSIEALIMPVMVPEVIRKQLNQKEEK